ncbi:MAG: patatin-like phospholipase family protein [Muribaculaceae bacterium]|nr:patatin-like phospholipase family protein [Muribaculaceae bacterium]
MSNFLKIIVSLILFANIYIPSSAQSVGLVLSGGGAKGIAHIGVIQALEDNGIPIDYITGTSMGSIVGGLYAAGFSPAEMMELIKSNSFSDWSTGTINEDYINYFSSPSKNGAMFYINLGRRDSTTQVVTPLLQGSLINPLPMNFAFMELFAPYTAQCDGNFNQLFVPFRCVASDVYAKRKVIFKGGSLGDAIRASMSFPIVFQPIDIDGVPLYDGGIYDNFPVDVMQQDFSPSFILGIDVTSGAESPDEQNIMSRLEALVMQAQSRSVPEEQGIKIHINLKKYSLLDFPKCQEIYKIGYERTMQFIDSIKSRVSREVPQQSIALKRAIFKSGTPAMAFDSITVHGGTPQQNKYVKYLFRKSQHRDSMTIDEARLNYYSAISSGKIRDLIPKAKYNNQTRLFNLDLKMSPKHEYSIGAGGYITSSTNSMIFLCAKYNSMSFNSFDAGISAWIGQAYYALEGQAEFLIHSPVPSKLGFEGVVSRQKFYENEVLFYKDNSPAFILNYDYHARLKYMLALGRKAMGTIGVGYGYLRERFYATSEVDFATHRQDESRRALAQLYLKAEGNSLNFINYPTKGHKWEATATGVLGKYKYMPVSEDTKIYESHNYLSIRLYGEKYWNFSRHFTLGAKGEATASTKKLLNNYTVNLVQAPAFAPTTAMQNYFNTAFRANSYVGAGAIPIYTISNNLQLRPEAYIFMPMQSIEQSSDGGAIYGKWFSNPQWMAQLAIVYSFPFASLSIYGNHLSYPKNNWNFGISFGILLPAKRFM